jgi:hypothetical protein
MNRSQHGVAKLILIGISCGEEKDVSDRVAILGDRTFLSGNVLFDSLPVLAIRKTFFSPVVPVVLFVCNCCPRVVSVHQ